MKEESVSVAFIKNLIAGVVIGIANIIPGVSGGTMMVILNMFDKIIEAVSGFRKNIKKNILYLLPILIGAAIGIIAFSKGITFMLENYPIIINFFFMGLIVGSVPLVFKSAYKKDTQDTTSNWKAEVKHTKAASIVAFLVAFLLLVVIAFTNAEETKVNINTVTVDFLLVLKLFFGGAIASIAMIIPGVSGSFVMVLLGIYPLFSGVAAALLPFDATTWMTKVLPIGIPIGLGILLGLLIGAKLIDVVLKKFPQVTYFGILGLLLGSLFDIYPGFQFDIQGLVAVVVCLVGFALAYFSSSDRVRNYFLEKKSAKVE